MKQDRIKKEKPPKNRVYVECSETTRRVKALVLDHTDRLIEVEMPTGFRMVMTKRSKRRAYSWRVGMMEFLSDGKLIS
jgi:hypothetical protein